jgi:hypothetical protein
MSRLAEHAVYLQVSPGGVARSESRLDVKTQAFPSGRRRRFVMDLCPGTPGVEQGLTMQSRRGLGGVAGARSGTPEPRASETGAPPMRAGRASQRGSWSRGRRWRRRSRPRTPALRSTRCTRLRPSAASSSSAHGPGWSSFRRSRAAGPRGRRYEPVWLHSEDRGEHGEASGVGGGMVTPVRPMPSAGSTSRAHGSRPNVRAAPPARVEGPGPHRCLAHRIVDEPRRTDLQSDRGLRSEASTKQSRPKRRSRPSKRRARHPGSRSSRSPRRTRRDRPQRPHRRRSLHRRGSRSPPPRSRGVRLRRRLGASVATLVATEIPAERAFLHVVRGLRRPREKEAAWPSPRKSSRS